MILDERQSGRIHSVTIMILVLVVCVAYSNTLFNGFAYDDEYQVLKNPWIKDFHSMSTVFKSEVWGFKGDSISNYYRPLLHVIYMIDYHLFGYQAWGYHATNLLLHALVTLLVYLLIHTILSMQNARYSWISSLSASLIFAVHPVHTEVVAPIMSVTDLMMTLFCISALCLHVRFLHRAWYFNLVPAMLFGLALLAKEIAITLPLVLISYDLLIEKKGITPWRLAKLYAPYAAVTLLYLAVRGSILGSFAPIDLHPELSTGQYFLNIFPLVVRYVFKLVAPVELNAMYEFHPVRSILETRALLSLIVVVALVAMGYIIARKSKIIAFGLALIVIPLLPAFYIRAIPYPFAERYLYLPSAGFVLVVAGLVSKYARSPKTSRILAIIFPIVLCWYTIGTIQRNGVWRDNYSLWSDTVIKSPNNAIVRSNLGEALKSRGRFSEAIEQIRIATELDPHTEFFRKLGNAYHDAGNWREALRQYEKAVDLEPANAMALNDLGALYGDMGDLDKAITSLEAAARLKPTQADVHYNLGMAYRDAGIKDKAAMHFEIAARINPKDPTYSNDLAETYREK